MKHLVCILLLLIPTIWLGQILHQTDIGPGSGREEGLMQKIFGDTREMIGQQMIQQADLYYHGGVGHADCDHGMMAGDSRQKLPEDHASEQNDGQTHAAHDHGDHGQEYKHEGGRVAAEGVATDWLTRLNAEIHPHGPKHMSGKNAQKELLPWLWAALRADPHNTSAYNIAAYWLAHRLDMPRKGLAVIKEGISNNPESFDLEVARGETLWHNLNDKPAAAAAFRQARAKFLAVYRPGEKTAIDDIPGPDRLLYNRSLTYLATYAQEQGDKRQAADYLRQAIPYAKKPSLLHRRLQKLENDE